MAIFFFLFLVFMLSLRIINSFLLILFLYNLILHTAHFMKTRKIKYSLIFIGISTSIAYADFIPNPLVMVTSEGVKPKIMLILDNSGSMVLATPSPTHPASSWMSRSEILHDSVVFLADKYFKDADFGISILNAQSNWQWPASLAKAQTINSQLFQQYGAADPDAVFWFNYGILPGGYYDYSQYGYYPWLNNHNLLPAKNWYSNWTLQTMTAKNAGVIMNISNLEQPANMNNFKRQVREIGPYNGTPLGASVTIVRNYFASNSVTPRPIQYRCQQNHMLMFTDGNASNGDYPAASAQIAWNANYLPTSGLDAAGKPWNSNGVVKQNIAFHGIYFGPERLGSIENPAFTNLKAAAVPSGGMVVNANSLDSLKAAFAKIINNIVITRSGTGGTYGAEDPQNLTNENKKDIYYSTTFAFKDWTSTINARNPDNSIKWSSLDTIKFADDALAYPTKFKTLTGTTETTILPHAMAADKNHVDWLIGYKLDDKLRTRSTPLSDIVGSVLNYSGKGLTLTASQIDASSIKSKWQAYATAKKNSFKSRLIVGSNDGLYNLIDPDSGVRTHAFLPPSLSARVADVADPNYTNHHSFGIDGVTVVKDVRLNDDNPKTIAVTGYGAGGKGLFAIQLFDGSNTEPKALWEARDVNRFGYTYGQPHLVKTADSGEAHRLIVANGYDAANGKSCLIELYPASGTFNKEYCARNPGNVEITTGNGLSSPAIINNSAGVIQFAYAGDLAGNLWKFDFTKPDVPVIKLFTDINNKPITTKPLILKKDDDIFIVFGSGKYLEQSDREGGNEKALHHIYGILDADQTTKVNANQLQAQEMKAISGSNYFEVTQNDVDYSTQKGWYLPLMIDGIKEGDRLVYEPQEYGINELLRFSLTSYKNIASTDPCLPDDSNIKGKILRILPFTGGMASHQTVDTNNDGKIDSSDKIVAGENISSPTGTAEIRLYDIDGNLLNRSETTTDNISVLTDEHGKEKNLDHAGDRSTDTQGITDDEEKVKAMNKVGKPLRIYLRTRF